MEEGEVEDPLVVLREGAILCAVDGLQNVKTEELEVCDSIITFNWN